MFLVSDGGDNHRRLTERELRRLVEEEDVQIHAIGIHDAPASREEMRGPPNPCRTLRRIPKD